MDFNCRVATNYEIRKWSEYLDTLCSSRRTSGINALGIIVENLFRQLRNCWDVCQYPASTAVASPIILDVFKFRSKREVKMKMLDIIKNRRIGTPILPGTDEFKFIKAFHNYSLNNSSTEILSFRTAKTNDILQLVAALPDSSTVIVDLDTIYKRIPDAQNDAVREIICNRIFRFIQYYKASHAGLLLDAALNQRPMTEFHRDSKSFINVFSTTEAVLNYLKGLILILQKTSPVATTQSPPPAGVSLESLDYTSVHWSFKRMFVEFLSSIENEAPSSSEDFEPELFNHWRQNEISRLMIVINDTSGRFNPEAKIKAQTIANDYEQLKTIHQKIKTPWDINPVKAKIDEAFHTAVLFIQNEFQTKKSLFIRKQTFVRYFGASLLLKSQIADFDDSSTKFSAQTTEKKRGTRNQGENDLGLLSDTSSLSDSDGAANLTANEDDDSIFKLMDITFELYLPIFEKFMLNSATNSIAMLYFFMVNQNFSVFHQKFVETLMDRFRESENINEKIKCTQYIVSFCCRSARIEAPVIEDILNSLIEPLHSSVVAMEKLSTVTGGETTPRGIVGNLPGTQRMMPLYETIFNGILEVMATRWKLLQHDASTDCLIRIICILASTESTLEILVTTPTDIVSRTHNQLKDFDFTNFEPIQTFVDLLASKGNLTPVEWPARPFDRAGLYHFEKMICDSQFWYDWNADPPIAQPPVALDTVKLRQIWDQVTAPKHKLVEITLLPGSTNHETKLLPLDLETRRPEKSHASHTPPESYTPTVNRPESPIPETTPSFSFWDNQENVDDYVDLETPKKNTTKHESPAATKRFRLSSNSSSSQDTTASRSVKPIPLKEAVENLPPLTDEKRPLLSPVPLPISATSATRPEQNLSPSNHLESSFSPDDLRPTDNLYKPLEQRTESPQIAAIHRSSLETRQICHDDVWNADLSYSPMLSESEGLVTPRIPAHQALQTVIMLEKIVETNEKILIQSQKTTELNSIVSQTLKTLADFIAKQQPLKSRQVTRAVNLAINSTMQIKCEPNVAGHFKATTNEENSDLEQHRHVTVATTETCRSKKRKKDRAHKDRNQKKRKVDIVDDAPVGEIKKKHRKSNQPISPEPREDAAAEDKLFSGLPVVSQKVDEKDLAPETEVRRSSKAEKSKGSRSEKSVPEKNQLVKVVSKPLCSIAIGVGIERGIAAGNSGLLYGLPQKCESKKSSMDFSTRPAISGIQVKEEDVGGWGKLLSAGFDYAQSMISLSSSEGKSQPRTQCGRRRRIRLLEAAANRL